MNNNTTKELTSKQKRRKLLKKIEKQRSSKVISYISQAPLDDTVLYPLYQELSNIGHVDRLDLILHSFGGNIDTPYKIVKLIRDYCSHFCVIVPVAAKSAASMIVLGADQIIMGPFAELGPTVLGKTANVLVYGKGSGVGCVCELMRWLCGSGNKLVRNGPKVYVPEKETPKALIDKLKISMP